MASFSPTAAVSAGHRIGTLSLVAALAFAAAVRLVDLGDRPLDPIEASQSAAAWWTAIGADADPTRLTPRPESGLLLGLQTLHFWVAGSTGDATARLVPAAAGTGLVLLAFWRRRTRMAAAVPLGVLVAVDPWLVASSRQASGAILAAGSALIAYVVLHRLVSAATGPAHAPDARRQATVFAAMAALAVVSGPVGWDFVPALLAVFVVAATGRRGVGAPPWRSWAGSLLAAGAVAMLLGTTSGLVQWRGPALVTSSLDTWIASWGLPAGSGGLGAPGWSAALVAYVVALVGLAAFGIFRSWRAGSMAGGFVERRFEAEALSVWLLWGAAVQLRGDARSWLVIQAPLLLGAAVGLEEIVVSLERRSPRVSVHALLAARAFLVAAAALVATLGIEREGKTSNGVRRLAGDVATLLERPLGERPSILVETADGSRIDALLAWYLRDAPIRWVAAAAAESSESRIVVSSRLLSANEAAATGPAPRYSIVATGGRMRVVELR